MVFYVSTSENVIFRAISIQLSKIFTFKLIFY